MVRCFPNTFVLLVENILIILWIVHRPLINVDWKNILGAKNRKRTVRSVMRFGCQSVRSKIAEPAHHDGMNAPRTMTVAIQACVYSLIMDGRDVTYRELAVDTTIRHVMTTEKTKLGATNRPRTVKEVATVTLSINRKLKIVQSYGSNVVPTVNVVEDRKRFA